MKHRRAYLIPLLLSTALIGCYEAETEAEETLHRFTNLRVGGICPVQDSAIGGEDFELSVLMLQGGTPLLPTHRIRNPDDNRVEDMADLLGPESFRFSHVAQYQNDIMKVITPISPFINSTHNVSVSTLKVIETRLK